MNNDDFPVLVSRGRVVGAVEWAYVLCGWPIQNDWWVEQWIFSRFCIKLEHSSMETIQIIQKAAAMGNWWWQLHHDNMPLMHYISCSFWWNIRSPRWLSPPSPRFGALRLLAFPKTKVTYESEKISDCLWDSGKYDGAADGDWKNCVRSQHSYLGVYWGVIFLCIMFLVSSSINVSIFHITWLDSFWTDLICTS